jgi:hypothetical protein
MSSNWFPFRFHLNIELQQDYRDLFNCHLIFVKKIQIMYGFKIGFTAWEAGVQICRRHQMVIPYLWFFDLHPL